VRYRGELRRAILSQEHLRPDWSLWFERDRRAGRHRFCRDDLRGRGVCRALEARLLPADGNQEAARLDADLTGVVDDRELPGGEREPQRLL